MIGKFVYIDPRSLGAQDKRVAWIPIEKEYRGGFLDHIDLLWGETQLSQRLDFWGVPFRCSLCHHTGHLLAQCPRRPSDLLHGKPHINHQKGRDSGRRPSTSFWNAISPQWHAGISRNYFPRHSYAQNSSLNGSSPIPIPSFPLPFLKSDSHAPSSLAIQGYIPPWMPPIPTWTSYHLYRLLSHRMNFLPPPIFRMFLPRHHLFLQTGVKGLGLV